MKSLDVAEVQQSILSRVAVLTPDRRARWGRMTAHQALCHLTDSFQASMGGIDVTMATGIFQRTVMKFGALYVPLRWPKGVPTRPEIDQLASGTAPVDFERDRAEEGFDHVTFAQSGVAEFSADAPYDAVVGRLILIHMPDARATLRHAASLARSGGIVAFQDFDLSRRLECHPPKPLIDRCSGLFVTLFTRALALPDMGMHLFQMMLDAGLSHPQCRVEYMLDGGPDSIIYEWFAETIRTLLPKLEAAGLVSAAELDIDTLAQRMRDEAVAIGGCLTGPILVSAAARKP